MKKNVLALSITAAVMGLGFAGGAQAIVTVGGATATSLDINSDGIGHILLVPYYTAQADNATLLNITNTDVVNGKAVKVRFRGASNSDDVFDFQVFLSPGDVWTANISKRADGVATLTTADASCTKPAKATLNATGFVTSRLDSAATAAQRATGTLEGYVEIFNMADIAPTLGAAVNPLFTAVKHVNSVAPCSGTAWTALDNTNLADVAAANAAGLTSPTTGLMANWTIINIVGTSTYGGAAVAIQANTTAVTAATATTAATFVQTAARGNIVYWPQTGTAVGAAAAYTADPLLRSGATVAAFYDLPDLSTPYTNTDAPVAAGALPVSVTAVQQAANLSGSIATTSVINEFLTDSLINATTDWVFSMPTRRYSVALNYATGAREYTALTPSYFDISNTLVSSRQICVTKITAKAYDREENTPLNSEAVVISPSTPAAPIFFCGEASVVSVNNGGSATPSGVLKATVARNDIATDTYKQGWINVSTPGATAGSGLPVLGSAFVRATAGTSQFGMNWDHRYTR